MTSRVTITRLRNYLASDLYRWLPPLLVIGVLLLSMALPFVASPRQLTLLFFLPAGVGLVLTFLRWPPLGLAVVDTKQNGRTHIPCCFQS
jgi:hypothetical protein